MEGVCERGLGGALKGNEEQFGVGFGGTGEAGDTENEGPFSRDRIPGEAWARGGVGGQ